jgi:hypothetical protein
VSVTPQLLLYNLDILSVIVPHNYILYILPPLYAYVNISSSQQVLTLYNNCSSPNKPDLELVGEERGKWGEGRGLEVGVV